MTEQIKNCNTCANATEDFNNDIDNGCYMCSKGIENNYEPNVAEQIKSAVEHYRDVCVQMGQYPESDTYRYAVIAINSLNAWEEVLQELEHDKEICFAHDSDEGFVYARVIELIKQKLEGVME